MTKARRNASVVLVGAMATIGAARASAEQRQTAGTGSQPAIVLHVANYAGVPSDVLNAAMNRAARVYEFIGVRMIWTEGPATPRTYEDDGLHLSVLLLSREMADRKISAEGIGDDVLGQAILPSGRASIFWDRIMARSGASTPAAVPLGAVIAHEVGHLVLPVNSHSRGGIMSADMDMQATQFLTFTNMQERAIRATLLEPDTIVARR